jgi:hypothetical protein
MLEPIDDRKDGRTSAIEDEPARLTRRGWWLPGIGSDVLVQRWCDVAPNEKPIVNPPAIGMLLERWLKNPCTGKALLEMCAAVWGYRPKQSWNASQQVRGELPERLMEAFRRGHLVLLVLKRPMPAPSAGDDTGKKMAAAASAQSNSSTPRKAEPKEVKTWIEIELIDDLKRPVPNEPYRITLPDGTTREGNLDNKGFAHLDGLDPGTCIVTFPNIHGKEWRRV